MNALAGFVHRLVFFSLIALLLSAGSGCAPSGGPSLPYEGIDATLPESVKTPLNALYGRKADDVLAAVETLGALGTEARAAIPYLVSLLDDPRLATTWFRGYGKPRALSKGAALALGAMGTEGVFALIDAIEGTVQARGMQDDLKREAVSEGLRMAMDLEGDAPFIGLKGSDRVLSIIRATQVCLALDENPNRRDPFDPRRNLKYYKYFSDVDSREGLATYIETLGRIGDLRALDLLKGIAPLAAEDQVGHTPRFDRLFDIEAILSQYRIDPLPLVQIHPPWARRLLIEWTARGDRRRVERLLSEGLEPDIINVIGRPVIEIAWRASHREVFEALIQGGASVDIRLSMNDTLLIRAARSGEADFVEALLEHGADPSLINNARETALLVVLDELLRVWNGKPDDQDAQAHLALVGLLTTAGAPSVPDQLLKRFDGKQRDILGL